MTAATPLNVAPITKPQPSIVAVDPATAQRWLKGNTVNRNVRDAAVNQYAADMVAGRWTFSNDAITFSPTGKLLNGQHRLNAVIKAGVTIPMLIMRGVPESAMESMDTGRKRSASDYFKFNGQQNAPLLAAALKLAIIYSDGRIYKDRKVQAVSNGEMGDFLDAEGTALPASVAWVSARARKVDIPPTVKAVAHWLFVDTAGRNAADGFFEALDSRTGLEKGSPILALDSRLRELRRNRTHATHRQYLYLVVKAWNHWRSGKAVATLSVQPKGGDARIPKVSH